jgi:hypothetical protein
MIARAVSGMALYFGLLVPHNRPAKILPKAVYEPSFSAGNLPASVSYDTLRLEWLSILQTYPLGAQERTASIKAIFVNDTIARDSLRMQWGTARTGYELPGAFMFGARPGRRKLVFFINENWVPNNSYQLNATISHEIGHLLDPREFVEIIPDSTKRLKRFRREFNDGCVNAQATESSYLKTLRRSLAQEMITPEVFLQECIADKIGLYLQSCHPIRPFTTEETNDNTLIERYFSWLESNRPYGAFQRCQMASLRSPLLIQLLHHVGPSP